MSIDSINKLMEEVFDKIEAVLESIDEKNKQSKTGKVIKLLEVYKQ